MTEAMPFLRKLITFLWPPVILQCLHLLLHTWCQRFPESIQRKAKHSRIAMKLQASLPSAVLSITQCMRDYSSMISGSEQH